MISPAIETSIYGRDFPWQTVSRHNQMVMKIMDDLWYNVGPLSDVCWFRFTPVTIVINIINHSYWSHPIAIEISLGFHCWGFEWQGVSWSGKVGQKRGYGYWVRFKLPLGPSIPPNFHNAKTVCSIQQKGLIAEPCPGSGLKGPGDNYEQPLTDTGTLWISIAYIFKSNLSTIRNSNLKMAGFLSGHTHLPNPLLAG